MRYFIHDSQTEACVEVSRETVHEALGEVLFDELEAWGSLSSGTTIYEARAEKHEPSKPVAA